MVLAFCIWTRSLVAEERRWNGDGILRKVVQILLDIVNHGNYHVHVIQLL
jgi:hypothetical protein